MAQNLPPLPQPGVSLYSGYMATKPETFVAKGRDAWSDRASYLISFSSPAGEALAPFLEIVEAKKNQISFKTTQGHEVMRIVKQRHTWICIPYINIHGMRGDGNEVWHLKLTQNLKGTKYQLTINEKSASNNQVIMQNKVNGADKGILINGQIGVTMTRHEEWKHVHRIDIINVAPGMDILLALGLSWIRADKQKQDTKTAVAAAT
ncbi:hypothetical protein DE146DRAFT_769002 [Phaeosphaeria sp. MPI-PUGE-AT-0046c]|nr:hypothetical protein DE146DRAFT_769002 [Phaeosphaeria sp. MPI-PUGE-AT-0046c]